MTYIGIRQGTVAQWVTLRPIFEVHAREKGYEGGRCRRDVWWCKEAVETQIRITLDKISRESRSRCQGKRNIHKEPGVTLGEGEKGVGDSGM